LLSAATPSRLLESLPPGVRVSRVPLDQAIARVRERLAPDAHAVHDALEETGDVE
jgi:ATP-dependent DNA helicase DinG